MLRNTCSYQYISKILRLPLIAGGVIVLLGGALWFIRTSNHNSIVGTWFVKASDAPFQYHMFVFMLMAPCSRQTQTLVTLTLATVMAKAFGKMTEIK